MRPDELRRAVEAALAGEWHEAHELVQADEADPIACWVHAVLHKIEGDPGNARYWYARASRLDCVDREPREELAAIRDTLPG
ncbi:MAG: hypothetical protein ACKOCX_12540 [Planctomycetota bacterium]